MEGVRSDNNDNINEKYIKMEEEMYNKIYTSWNSKKLSHKY